MATIESKVVLCSTDGVECGRWSPACPSVTPVVTGLDWSHSEDAITFSVDCGLVGYWRTAEALIERQRAPANASGNCSPALCAWHADFGQVHACLECGTVNRDVFGAITSTKMFGNQLGAVRCAAGHSRSRSIAIGFARGASSGKIGASFFSKKIAFCDVDSTPTAMEWSPRGQMLAVGYYDGSLDVFSFQKNAIKHEATHKKFSQPISGISWSSDNMTIAHTSFGQGGVGFAMATNPKASTSNKKTNTLIDSVSVFGNSLAIAGKTLNGHVKIWQWGTWREVDNFDDNCLGNRRPAVCKFHPTKTLVATFSSVDRTCLVHQVAVA